MTIEGSTPFDRLSAVFLGSLLLLLGSATPASAHAFVERYDLPVPLWYYLTGAGMVVALTFALLAVARESPAGSHAEVDISRTKFGRLAASRRVHGVLAILSVATFVFLLLTGLLGAQEDPFANILPAFVWVAWWVGFGFVCALVGNFWPAINPWVAAWSLFGPGESVWIRRTMPSWIGMWPAVLFYLCFAWAELVWPDNAVPSKLAAVILIYSGITWLGMAGYGVRQWLAAGEVFSIVFALFGRFAPLARQQNGRLVVRPFGAGLVSSERASVSMVVFVVVVLASVSFDGFLHTAMWGHIYAGATQVLYDSGVTGLLGNTGSRTLVMTVGLVGASAGFIAVFLGICQMMALLAGRDAAARPSAFDMAGFYCLTLVPIAIAYHLAHYLVLLLVEGQRLYSQLSDPMGWGWNLFGTAGTEPDPSIVDARFVWLFSLIVIVGGHAIAVWLSHEVARSDASGRRADLLPQVPMLILMIGYTVLSLWIIGQPIVKV